MFTVQQIKEHAERQGMIFRQEGNTILLQSLRAVNLKMQIPEQEERGRGGYEQEQAEKAKAFDWMHEMRLHLMQSFDRLGSPLWVLFDVDDEVIATGETPLAAVEAGMAEVNGTAAPGQDYSGTEFA